MTRRKIEGIEKIKKRFPGEWLLIVDYEMDEIGHLVTGKLVMHSKKRDDIYRQQMKYKEPVAIRYAGPIPKDLVVMFYV